MLRRETSELHTEEEVESYVKEFERAGGNAVFSTYDALEEFLAASSGWTQTMVLSTRSSIETFQILGVMVVGRSRHKTERRA